jgi:hypothetical protein
MIGTANDSGKFIHSFLNNCRSCCI